MMFCAERCKAAVRAFTSAMQPNPQMYPSWSHAYLIGPADKPWDDAASNPWLCAYVMRDKQAPAAIDPKKPGFLLAMHNEFPQKKYGIEQVLSFWTNHTSKAAPVQGVPALMPWC